MSVKCRIMGNLYHVLWEKKKKLTVLSWQDEDLIKRNVILKKKINK